MEDLTLELSKLGKVEVIKDGVVFILLMTRDEKSTWNARNFFKVVELVTNFAIDKPIVEVTKNNEDFILIVLKPLEI